MNTQELNKKIADNNTEIQRLRNECYMLTQPQPPFDYVIYHFLRQLGFNYEKEKAMLDNADAAKRQEISRIQKEIETLKKQLEPQQQGNPKSERPLFGVSFGPLGSH